MLTPAIRPADVCCTLHKKHFSHVLSEVASAVAVAEWQEHRRCRGDRAAQRLAHRMAEWRSMTQLTGSSRRSVGGEPSAGNRFTHTLPQQGGGAHRGAAGRLMQHDAAVGQRAALFELPCRQQQRRHGRRLPHACGVHRVPQILRPHNPPALPCLASGTSARRKSRGSLHHPTSERADCVKGLQHSLPRLAQNCMLLSAE